MTTDDDRTGVRARALPAAVSVNTSQTRQKFTVPALSLPQGLQAKLERLRKFDSAGGADAVLRDEARFLAPCLQHLLAVMFGASAAAHFGTLPQAPCRSCGLTRTASPPDDAQKPDSLRVAYAVHPKSYRFELAGKADPTHLADLCAGGGAAQAAAVRRVRCASEGLHHHQVLAPLLPAVHPEKPGDAAPQVPGVRRRLRRRRRQAGLPRVKTSGGTVHLGCKPGLQRLGGCCSCAEFCWAQLEPGRRQ